MTTDNSIQNSVQDLAKPDEDKLIISKIEPIIFQAGGKPYTQLELNKAAPFLHVQKIVGKVVDSVNSNVIDTLNTTLKAEQAKVTKLVSTIGSETAGLIKEINDIRSLLEPPPMDSPEFL
ncbi:MAG: hypothetical protein LBU02_04050 [Rickettsiales bacterium]|nr:hypothetical protein [Rickettsiales bacterium]